MPNLWESGEAWYCFRALPKREHLAAARLRAEAGIEVLAPRLAYNKQTRRGKVRTVEAVFPGYLFLRADLKTAYRQIRATPGIRDVVAFGERVPPIPALFIEELRQHLGDDEVKPVKEPSLERGQTVTITEGPFRNLQAVVNGELDAQMRVALLLEFLGRPMEVKVDSKKLMLEKDEPQKRLWES
jgi:transcriptional antiterminator RfaH